MPSLPTRSRKTSCRPRGTGLACTRCLDTQGEGVRHTIGQFGAQTLAVLQAGFKSASDYETFVWVREEDLPEINENIEVKPHRHTRNL